MSDHLHYVIKSRFRTIYDIRVLCTHSMLSTALQDVFSAAVSAVPHATGAASVQLTTDSAWLLLLNIK